MYRTAEFVTPKHPDKLCDQVSDAILDACLKDDPSSRVAVETMGGHGLVKSDTQTCHLIKRLPDSTSLLLLG